MSVFFWQTAIFGISSVSMVGHKFVLQKAFHAAVEALNDLVNFFPHGEDEGKFH
jgi:hypothetical protein